MLPFIDLKFIKLPMYGLSIMMGILVAGFIANYFIKKEKKVFEDFILISTLTVAFGFIFAKILYILVSFPIQKFFVVVWQMLTNKNEIGAGFVFYGGLFGGVLGYYIGTKIVKVNFLEYADMYAFLIPVVHGFGRIGCFCGGCCYGIPYEGPFAVHYKNPITSVPVNIGIFPVQLLETLLLFIVAAILIFLYVKNKKHLFIVYGFSYSVIRFFLEYLRYDSERGQIGSLSVSQFISLLLFIFCICFYIFLFVKNKGNKVKTDD